MPSKNAFAKIHPSIGIARVGNSPDGFFIGLKVPGIPPSPVGGFKDTNGYIKRQAPRFSVLARRSFSE
jgi:hypothetical protein